MAEILGSGVVHYLGLITGIVDRIKAYVSTSSKCFALFPPAAKPAQIGRA
jgi:hypothetical protein